MKSLFFLFPVLCISAFVQGAYAQQTAARPMGFMAGVDVSEMAKLQQHGAVYKLDGVPLDPFKIFRQDGVNWMRVRLFVDPSGEGPLCNDLPYTLKLAREIKAQGFRLLLDFHYSDTWADPSQQMTPKAWAGLSHDQLVLKVKSYTRDTLRSFAAVNAAPDMVEIGNEITNGMLWPDGRVSPASTDKLQWAHFTDLVKAGSEGARDSGPVAKRPLILIHVDRGGDVKASQLFYDHLCAAGVPFDVIGPSDYPWWQGSLYDLKTNLNELAERYGKPIVVVETAFPYVPQSMEKDGQVYKGKDAVDHVLHYPPSPEGQAEYLRQMTDVVRSIPNQLGIGMFYWAAAWVKTDGWGAPSWSHDWEERALFNADGDALPALKALGEAAAPQDSKKLGNPSGAQ